MVHDPSSDPSSVRTRALEPVAALGQVVLVLAWTGVGALGLAVPCAVVVAARAGRRRAAGVAELGFDVATVASSLLLLAAGLVALVWCARARRNAQLLDPLFHHRRSEVWAWAGWIVPVVSLWFPYQVLRDVHRASTGAPAAPPPGRAPAFRAWWAAWLATLLLARWTGAALDSPGATGWLGVLALAEFAANVVALVLFARVVRAVGTAQAPR